MSLRTKLLWRLRPSSSRGHGISRVQGQIPRCPYSIAAHKSLRPAQVQAQASVAPPHASLTEPRPQPHETNRDGPSSLVMLDPTNDYYIKQAQLSSSLQTPLTLKDIYETPTQIQLREHAETLLNDRDSKNASSLATERFFDREKHPGPLAGAAMEKPGAQYPSKRETLASQYRQLGSQYQQKRLDSYRSMTGSQPADWRKILHTMKQRTKPPTWKTRSQSRTLLTTDEVADNLLYRVDRTLWDIAEKTECRITMWKPPAGDLGPSHYTTIIVLSGSDRAIELAKAEISTVMKGTEPYITPTPNAVDAATSSPSSSKSTALADESGDHTADPSARPTWSSENLFQRPGFMTRFAWYQKYEDYPRPKKWDSQSFLAYIEALTKADIPRGLSVTLYGSVWNEQKAVLGLIKDAFESEEAASSLSTRALKAALLFAQPFGMIYRPSSRLLLGRAEAVGLPLDTEVYNILLRGNVKQRDLRNFGTVLDHMSKHGLSPNLRTWNHFLHIIQDDAVLRHAVHEMDRCNLLKDPRAKQMVATRLIALDLQKACADWKGIHAFLAEQDRRYGPGWLSKPGMHALFSELGRQGKFSSSLQLIDAIISRGGVKPNLATLNIILTHAQLQQNPAMAVAALHRFHALGVPLDETSYTRLFVLMAKLRKANAMGLVWRLACLEHKATWHMWKRVAGVYAACPWLLPGSTEATATPPASSSSSIDAAARPRTDYRRLHALPTFHEPFMVPELLERLGGPLRTPLSFATSIAQLYRLQFPGRRGWRSVTPPHALLAEALEADRALEEDARQDRARFAHTELQQRGLSGDKGGHDSLSTTPTKEARIVVPGVALDITKRLPARFIDVSWAPSEVASADDKAPPGMLTEASLEITIFRRNYAVPLEESHHALREDDLLEEEDDEKTYEERAPILSSES